MSDTLTVEVISARPFRDDFRDVMNRVVNKSQAMVVYRYSAPEGVMIPYEWLMNAHNGDFVQLVHQVKTAVESAS